MTRSYDTALHFLDSYKKQTRNLGSYSRSTCQRIQYNSIYREPLYMVHLRDSLRIARGLCMLVHVNCCLFRRECPSVILNLRDARDESCVEQYSLT